MVPTLGGMELLIILAVILLFFGATRVPQLGRALGRSVREFRKGTEDSDEEQRELKERGELSREEEEAPPKETHAQTAPMRGRDERHAE